MRPWSAVSMVLAALLLTGCAGTAVGLRSTNSPSLGGSLSSSGTSSSSAAIQVEGRPNSYFGLVFLGYLMIGVADSYRHWSDGPGWRTPPDLDQARRVAERDCSQPLGTLKANLRCK